MKIQPHVFQQDPQLILKQIECAVLRKCFGLGLTSDQNDLNTPLIMT